MTEQPNTKNERLPQTYKEFVEKYGNHPKDIVFMVVQKDTRLATAKEIFDEIEKFKNKEHLYHHICWGTGFLGVSILMIDRYGENEIFKCSWAREDRSCSPEICPHKGQIKGYLELNKIEQTENWLIEKIIETLKSRYLPKEK